MNRAANAIRIDPAAIGRFARRFTAQAAMSATIMTGLHVASLQGVAPADWLFGPAREADAPGAVAAEPAALADRSAGPEQAPTLRFVAIPASETFAEASGKAPASEARQASAAPRNGAPSPESTIPAHYRAATPRNAAIEETMPETVARPTPRPVTSRLQTTVVASASRPSPQAIETAWADPQSLPFDLSPPTADIPELTRDPAPLPLPVEDRGFAIFDLVPEREAIFAGVSSVGLHARGAIVGAAKGAMELVDR